MKCKNPDCKLQLREKCYIHKGVVIPGCSSSLYEDDLGQCTCPKPTDYCCKECKYEHLEQENAKHVKFADFIAELKRINDPSRKDYYNRHDDTMYAVDKFLKELEADRG